jgi:hydrogenase nickel incorporation protein HypA/HybF
MHELSIAVSMIDLATQELEERGASRCEALHLKLGRLSGVVKEALVFSWDVACEGTPLSGSRLLIEEVPGNELEVVALEIDT